MKKNLLVRFTLCVFFVLCCFNFCSCKKEYSKKISVDNFSQIPIDEKWLVITAPYVNFYENHDTQNLKSVHGRKGDMLKVTGKHFENIDKNKTQTWYKTENGWIQEEFVFICTNKFQAQAYSEKVSQF